MPDVRSLSTNYNVRLWNPSILPSFSLGAGSDLQCADQTPAGKNRAGIDLDNHLRL